MAQKSNIDFSERDFSEGINSIFVERWSPKSFKNTPISDEKIVQILNAARWAPSSFNEQPWRFAISNQQTFNTYLSILTEGNKGWAKNASRIGFIIAQKFFSGSGKPNPHANFDCGAAWMALTLQAKMLGIYSRGMAGFRPDIAYSLLQIDPDKYHIVMGFALGEINDDAPYTTEHQEKPSGRRPLSEIIIAS